MNIVNSGNTFTIYGEEVQTFKQLPANTYKVQFSPMSGFSLCIHDDVGTDEKVYGSMAGKADKVLNAFDSFKRNMGIILSGPKGAGKSMFARVLAERGRKKDLPMIIVDRAYSGLSDFLSSIKQECIILFDEFEKTFDEEEGDQDSLLSLFDGLDSGKKLFVLTCNEVRQLSDYFLNRPGRFHYHFEFGTPNSDEIKEYLEDNLLPDVQFIIPDILRIGAASDFTYDILRAIVFEINNGYTLEETLKDLNIERTTSLRVHMELEFDDGTKAVLEDAVRDINLEAPRQYANFILVPDTAPEEIRQCDLSEVYINGSFNPKALQFVGDTISLAPGSFVYRITDCLDDDESALIDKFRSERTITKITITKVTDKWTRKMII